MQYLKLVLTLLPMHQVIHNHPEINQDTAKEAHIRAKAELNSIKTLVQLDEGSSCVNKTCTLIVPLVGNYSFREKEQKVRDLLLKDNIANKVFDVSITLEA